MKEVNRGLEFPMVVVLLRNGALIGLLVVAVVRVFQARRRLTLVYKGKPPTTVTATVADDAPVPVRIS